MSDTIVQNQITPDALRRMQTDYLGQFLLDNSKFLETIYHFLKGETLTEELQDHNGEKVLVPAWKRLAGVEPILTDFGINKTMQVLNMVLTPTTATGNLDEEKISVLAYSLVDSLLRIYTIYFKECGFQNVEDIRPLGRAFLVMFQSHFSKSDGMEFVNRLTSSYNISEIRGDKKVVQEPTMTL